MVAPRCHTFLKRDQERGCKGRLAKRCCERAVKMSTAWWGCCTSGMHLFLRGNEGSAQHRRRKNSGARCGEELIIVLHNRLRLGPVWWRPRASDPAMESVHIAFQPCGVAEAL
eukprot:1534610-Pyramimonas_sp.AAC.1